MVYGVPATFSDQMYLDNSVVLIYCSSLKSRNHNSDFNHEQYIKSTELSKYIWSLKDAGTPYTINWSIVAKVKGSTKVDYCPLCLTEKYHLIEYFKDTRLLNK